jgi:GTPase
MQRSTTEHQKTKRSQPKALVITVQRPEESDAEIAVSGAEMRRLAATLGIEVVAHEVQKRQKPSSSTYVGSGKLKELSAYTDGPGEVSPTSDEEEPLVYSQDVPQVELVLVDDELSPRQHRILEISFDAEVLDRTAVILEIFERRARTKEARLEVEIARLNYELPRRRDDATKRGRRGGGGRGERGHTNVELDKARIRDRIAFLEQELTDAQARHASRRDRRQEVFQVVLVGYTNAGKSSMMRGLTGSEVLVEDKLFATLGTTVRQLHPRTKPPILVSDTVGFVKNLPHELVASFRSTLDEALEAAHILLVVDASDPDWPDQLAVTEQTLESIGASEIPTQLVLNKVDTLSEQRRREFEELFPEAIQISALDEGDLTRLRERILRVREMGLCDETLMIPYTDGHLLGEIYERALVDEERHTEEGTVLRVRARTVDLARWKNELEGGAP